MDITPEEEYQMMVMTENGTEVRFAEARIKEYLLPFSERQKIQASQEFKDFLIPWNEGEFNKAEKVGKLMDAINRYASGVVTPTREGWMNFYFQAVRSYEDVNELVRQMANATKLSFATALNYWVIHIIDSTYMGLHGEQVAAEAIREYIASKGLPYVVLGADDRKDRIYGIDGEVIDQDGKIIMAYQAKPSSYFRSQKATVVAARDGYNRDKYAAYKNRFGADVWYVDWQKTEQTGKLVWWNAMKEASNVNA